MLHFPLLTTTFFLFLCAVPRPLQSHVTIKQPPLGELANAIVTLIAQSTEPTVITCIMAANQPNHRQYQLDTINDVALGIQSGKVQRKLEIMDAGHIDIDKPVRLQYGVVLVDGVHSTR